MGNLSRHILVSCLLLLGIASASAQQKERFDASRHSMQKRHVRVSERFATECGFFDNTFISAYSGFSQTFRKKPDTYSMGPGAGIAFGKWFSDISGVRLDAYGSWFRRNSDGEMVRSAGAEASYLYNLIFNPQFLSMHLVSGLGYMNGAAGQGEKIHDLSAHIGLNMGMRLFRNIDFYFEPAVRMQAGLGGRMADWKGARFLYELNFGLSYNFIPEEIDTYKPSYKSGCFISIMGGAQFQVSDLAITTAGVFGSMGPQIAVSAGKWYSELFALRASVFHADDIYARHLDRYRFKTYYHGFRLEAMFEFLHLIPEHSAEKLNLSVLVGPELGFIHKQDLNKDLRSTYFGMCGGLQLGFKVGGPVSMFLEPRFSMVPYSFAPSHSVTTEASLVNYIDVVTSLNLGVSVSL